jgi:hypothetical protein
VLRLALLVAILTSLPSCACSDERTRNEAMLFLDRFEDVDVDDPLEDRRAAIEGIRGLTLSDEDVLRARNACVDAHEALIEAEDQHAAARHQLVVASHGGSEVPPDIARQVEDAIDASDQAIERSRELFPRCTREVNALESRFHHRHPS